MKVAVIGTGPMGRAITARLARTGLDVMVAGRNRWNAFKTAEAAGGRAQHGELLDAVAFADILFLAVPHDVAATVARGLGGLGGLSGKILIDLTNPKDPFYSPGFSGLQPSIAEAIQTAMPFTRVVKAFNTILAKELSDDTPSSQQKLVYIASDCKVATEQVRCLALAMKLNPAIAGRLFNSRFIEPVGMLNLKAAVAGT